MSKILERIENILIYSSMVSIFIMVLLTTADATGRYLFSFPILGSYEIVEKYFMVFSVFFALSFAYRQGANIRVTFLVARLPEKWKLPLNYFVQTFSLLFVIALLTTSFVFSIQRFDDNLIVDKYTFPLAPAYCTVPLGLFFMALRVFFDFWNVKRGDSGLFREDSSEGDM